MSTYSAGQAKFNACLRAVRSVIGELQAVSERIHSAALTAAARNLTVHDPSEVELRDVWEDLARAIPDHDKVLETLAPERFRAAQQLTEQAMEAARAGTDTAGKLAAAASTQLQQALAVGAAELGRHERLTTADIAARAAMDLGYSVGRCDGGSVTGIEAWRGDELILMRIRDQGQVEIDHAGLIDDQCQDRQAALEAQMSGLGVDLVGVGRDNHGRQRGGVLIAAAARRGDSSLARATVLDVEASATTTAGGPAVPGKLFGDSAGTGRAVDQRRLRAGNT